MAGIGFELRRLLQQESYAGLIRAYGFAGIISAGPWLLSIVAVLAMGWLRTGDGQDASRFQVCVTYLMCSSLVLTGLLQLLLTRFCADRLYEGRPDRVAPNVLGAITLATLGGGAVAAVVLGLAFDESLLLRLLLLGCFVALCDLWIVVLVLSGLRAYRAVLLAFVAGYGLTVLGGAALRPLGLPGLLLAFLLGQALLVFALLGLILRRFPSSDLLAFDFLRRGQAFPDLALTGLLYNLSVWADKLVFWFSPATSAPVLGPLRVSIIYDMPIFLAHLLIVPGMAVFLVRIETDFAEQYDAFYGAVRDGGTLQEIERARDAMVYAVRQGLYEIFKVQGLTLVLLVLGGHHLLRLLGISPLYIHLLHVDAAAVSVQVLLLAVLSVLFYLDQRRAALGLTLFLAVSNLTLTLLTQRLGPAYYGYGYAAAVTVTGLLGLQVLSRKLDRLEFETFMLQGGS